MLNFVKLIKKGDLVALPLKSRPSIMLGEIISDYQYKEITSDVKHIRFVNWIGEIPRFDIDEDLLKSLGTFMTVFKIRKLNAERPSANNRI